MKKMICLLVAAILLVGILSVPAFAKTDENNMILISDANSEMEVYVQSDLPQDVQARIYAHFRNGAEKDEPTRNVLCTLFGHQFTQSTSSTVSHNVYTTSPKCVKNTYNTNTCTRCGYVETELVSSVRISTCHG